MNRFFWAVLETIAISLPALIVVYFYIVGWMKISQAFEALR